MTKAPKFKIGDAVQTSDQARYQGNIVNIQWHKGDFWYVVRLPGGDAVCYERDLSAR